MAKVFIEQDWEELVSRTAAKIVNNLVGVGYSSKDLEDTDNEIRRCVNEITKDWY